MKLIKIDDTGQLDEILSGLDRPSIDDAAIVETVGQIISEVASNGDAAVKEQIKKFDECTLDSLSVSDAEIDEAYEQVPGGFINALNAAKKRIAEFHEKEMPEPWTLEEKGIKVGETIKPLDSVGCYVPGGRAAYPSSVLMTVVPAKVAGVKEIIVCTPAKSDGKINPYTLVACAEAGCRKIFKIGGASAVAAMAYGTESVPRVDKIVGPGNIYVTIAKKLVYGRVGIDSLAGPSEVVIIAEKGANAKFVSLDLLAQSEHGSGATAILIATDEEAGNAVIEYIKNNSGDVQSGQLLFLLADNLGLAFELANKIAPEHIELFVEEPFKWLDKVRNAGAILLGEYTPASFGDYIAGPNHVLPTGAAARFQSPLGTRDFIKYQSVLYCDKEALAGLAGDIDTIASAEGLVKHARSTTERLK